ncbi:MAG: hypothetical protein ACE5PV_12120 [Candidatus Poribacteria bacterium]
MATIVISDELLHQAEEIAANVGYPTLNSLIEEAIRQKLFQLQAEKSQRFTQRIRDKMQRKGISEEAILADFERFRQSISKEIH